MVEFVSKQIIWCAGIMLLTNTLKPSHQHIGTAARTHASRKVANIHQLYLTIRHGNRKAPWERCNRSEWKKMRWQKTKCGHTTFFDCTFFNQSPNFRTFSLLFRLIQRHKSTSFSMIEKHSPLWIKMAATKIIHQQNRRFIFAVNLFWCFSQFYHQF